MPAARTTPYLLAISQLRLWSDANDLLALTDASYDEGSPENCSIAGYWSIAADAPDLEAPRRGKAARLAVSRGCKQAVLLSRCPDLLARWNAL